MTVTLQQVSEAIADALVNVGGSGLDVTPFPTEGATPPFAQLEFVSWTPEAFTRGGVKRNTFNLRVFVAKTSRPQDAYFELLEFMDSTSAKSIDLAVWDIELDGVSIYVSEARMLAAEEVDGVDNLGALFQIEVAKKGA